MTRVAVVILNYNGASLLRQFLPSVIQHSAEADIYVADNGSTDNSVDVLRSDFPRARLILLGSNFGFCGGYNRALQSIESDYFVLLNSDVGVTPDWLAPMKALLDAHPEIASVQPKILDLRNRTHFEYAGAGGGFIDALGYPFCRGRIFGQVEEDRGQYDDERPVFWSSGACMMIRARSFYEYGGFDEDFFAHMEEIDLCWKLARGGSLVYYSGKSTVYHLGAGTLEYQHPRKTYFNFRNGLSMLFKHYDPVEVVTKIPARIALDWVAAISFILKGEGRNFVSVLRAHVDFFRHLRSLRAKRRAIRRANPTYPKENIYGGLILYRYFSGRTPTTPLNSPRSDSAF